MTPQKFKPGDKVAVIKQATYWLADPNRRVAFQISLNLGDIYTVIGYRDYCMEPFPHWPVKLSGLNFLVDEGLLAPVVSDEDLAKFWEEIVNKDKSWTLKH